MHEPSQAPAEKPRNSSLGLWLGLLLLTGVVFIYLMTSPRGGSRRQGRDFPGVGVELSTLQFEPLTGGAERIRKEDLRGKVAVINFWATWCPACRAEMPHLLKLRDQFAGNEGFQLILASSNDAGDFERYREQTEEYMASLDPSQPTWDDEHLFTMSGLIRQTGINGDIPVTAVLDRQGVVRGLWIGFHPDDPLAWAELVEELLAAPAGHSAESEWQEKVSRVRAGKSDSIALEAVEVSDADLSQLAGLTGLKTLAIERSRISDAGMKSLAGLTNLESLKIRGAAVADNGARQLAELPNLRFVNLPQARITDEGLAELAQLPKLELLRFGSPNVTDEGMKHVASMQSLRFLHLIHVPISDAGLKPLHSMKNLESFYVDGGRVTDEGLSELLKANPDLHIHLDQHHLDNDPRAHEHSH